MTRSVKRLFRILASLNTCITRFSPRHCGNRRAMHLSVIPPRAGLNKRGLQIAPDTTNSDRHELRLVMGLSHWKASWYFERLARAFQEVANACSASGGGGKNAGGV
jgi:hypothetical protein